MEPWQVWPPDEFGKLALWATQAIFEGWGGIRGVKGSCTHFVQKKGGRSILWEAVTYAQGRYAMVAFGNQCEPFSIVTPTRAKL